MANQLKMVYYAHAMIIYNTPQETRDIDTLHKLNLYVINPNRPSIQQEVEDCDTNTDEEYAAMFEKVFFTKVRRCQVFAFRPLPDGRIPGGVAMELKVAQKAGLIIIELPCNTHARCMGKDDTREFMRDIGNR